MEDLSNKKMVKKNKIMIGHNAVKELDGGIHEEFMLHREALEEIYSVFSNILESKSYKKLSKLGKIQEFKNKLDKYKGKNGN